MSSRSAQYHSLIDRVEFEQHDLILQEELVEQIKQNDRHLIASSWREEKDNRADQFLLC